MPFKRVLSTRTSRCPVRTTVPKRAQQLVDDSGRQDPKSDPEVRLRGIWKKRRTVFWVGAKRYCAIFSLAVSHFLFSPLLRKEQAASPDHDYPSPPKTGRKKSRSIFMTADSGGVTHTSKRTTTCQETEVDENPPSDSDSDSLADLEDTPTKSIKRPRTLPTRQSRHATKYFAEDDADASGVEESDGEFDPFKMREEERKKEARRSRTRRYASESDEE